MAVQLKTVSPLGRELFVEVPANEITAEVEKRIEQLSKTTRIDGFRKGKIPHKIIEERYGEGVFNEVIQELWHKSLKEALAAQQLEPVSNPRVKTFQAAKKEPLRYEVVFDIRPEITLADLHQISIERKIVSISDENVEEVIERLRKQQADWILVERSAVEGDKLFLDVKVDVTGASIKDMHRLPAELGARTMIPGFEEGLIGAKAGDEVILHLAFPDPYFDASIAGKPAKFTIQVLEVLEAQLPSDEVLAEKLAIKDGVAGLKENVREHVQREANQLVKTDMKNQLWEKLMEANQFDLPGSLIEEELHRILHPQATDDDGHRHDDATIEQRQQAERRVKMGLLLSEAIKAYQVKLDVERLRAKVEEMVAMFENPAEMAKQYYQNREFLLRLQANILEEQTVDELLKVVKIIDREVNYNEMFK